MTMERDNKGPGRELGRKYKKLRVYLEARPKQEWRTTFSNIESILGFRLPASARVYSGWWTNKNSSGRHSQAVAWSASGWETAEVDMVAETLLFKPKQCPTTLTAGNLDEAWPPRDPGP